MAGDEDWLALQIANAQSPFRTFQKPDAPFEASEPGPDTVYTTQDVNRIQGHQGRSNPLRSAFRWVADKIKGYQEAPGGNPDEHKLAGSLRLSDIPLMIAESGERYAGGFGHAMHGENRPGTGFAGTGVDEPAMLVPPQAAAAFIPGLKGAIIRGEAKPTSTYDWLRSKAEESPLFNWERPGVLGDRGPPLPGAPTLPSIWPGPEFLPETGPAWKHQANPFSEEAGRIRGHLKSLTGEETWPKAPPFEDTSPLGPNGSKSMNAEMGRPGNERDVGEVKLNAEGDARLAPFARRTEPLPVTDAVKQWLEMATGKEPRVQVATGPNQTDYVKVPVDAGFHRNGIKVPFVRVAEDAHPGRPRPGQIDTAPAEHPKFTDESNRRNAAGDPFGTDYPALVDSLKWATSSTPLRKGIPPGQWAGPEGNWLVEGAEPHAAGGQPYGKMPQWARYAKEEPAPKPVEGADFSPEQLKLLAKTGDLKTMLAAARGDPDKLASIRKTIESLKGVSPGGIAKVLETQHGLDVHPGDVPQVLRELDRNRFPMPNQAKPSLQSRIDKAYEHTRPGPRSIRSEPDFPQRFWDAWDRHQGHQQKVADELGVSQSTVNGWKNQIPRPSPQTPEGAAAEAARFSAQRAEVGKRTLDAGNRYRGGRSFMNEGKRELTPQEPLLGKKAPSRVEALREQRSQGQASEAELARRGGKPFWDETGRARAQEEDFEAIKRLFPAKRPKDDTTLFARGRPWLEAEIGHAHQLHKQMTDEGRSMQWLADQLGRSKASVQSLMEREGLKSPLRQGGLKDETLAALKEAEERGVGWKPTYEHGDSARSIAVEHGLHPNTLHQLLKRRAAKADSAVPSETGNAPQPSAPFAKEERPIKSHIQGLLDEGFDDLGNMAGKDDTLYAGRRGGVHAFVVSTPDRLKLLNDMADKGHSIKEIVDALHAHPDKHIMSKIMGHEDTMVPSQIKGLEKYIDERREAKKMRGD